MAERWQQWMPHDIDKWQGSANIQALSDLAYRAVHNLLQDMWKQPDCALPLDDRDLAKRSRVAGRWVECRDEVLEYFSDRTPEGSLTHRVLLVAFEKAQQVYAKRSDGAKRTNASRSPTIERGGERTQSERTASRNADTVTRTGTSTEQKQKPSRDKREPDPRHVSFRTAIEAYAAHMRVKLPWDGSEAKQLDLLLKSSPDLNLAEFQACLNHRARSPGTPHGERPRLWLPNILKYQQGPLNEFGKTEETFRPDATVGMHKPAEKSEEESRAEALDFWRGCRDRGSGAYVNVPSWAKSVLDAELVESEERAG